jgi:hypothetical protein
MPLRGIPIAKAAAAFAVIAVTWALDALWSWRTGIRLVNFWAPLALAILAANVAVFRSLRGGERAAALAEGFILLFVFGSGAMILQCAAASLAAPFADDWLARADRFLGFDWVRLWRFTRAHPSLAAVLLHAYNSIAWQTPVCVILLSLSGRIARCREFLATFAVGFLIGLALFAAFPARGAFAQYGVIDPKKIDFLNQLMALREGHVAVLRADQIDGLINFPSFHILTAVLVSYAARGTPLAQLVWGLNIVMIAATPVFGGHYLVDCIAGAAVAALSIAVVRYVQTFAPAAPQETAPQQTPA